MATVREIDRIAGQLDSLLSTSPQTTVAGAAEKMARHHVGCLLVIDESQRLVGIFTERDILREIVAKHRDPGQTLVAEIMITPVISCTPQATTIRAEEMMAEHGVRHLPIVDNGEPIGMVSSRDLHAHKLAFTQALASQQSSILNDLEARYPGITRLDKDRSGRVMI